jgi:hypothetical protein
MANVRLRRGIAAPGWCTIRIAAGNLVAGLPPTGGPRVTLPGIDLLNHLMPLFGVATGVLISMILNHRRTEARNAIDASRLRAALQVELAMLQAAYEDNLRLLESGHDFLPSSRQMITLYRANLGRIQLLNEVEIPAIVAAYGYNEVVESYLGATCKQLGQAYRVLTGETPVNAIRQRFHAGRAHIAAALDAMNLVAGERSAAASPEAPPRPSTVPLPTLLAEQTVPA